MGRKSREKWERRQGRGAATDMGLGAGSRQTADPGQADRIRGLEEQLSRLSDGDFEGSYSPSCSDDVREAHLQDILAFESVGSAPSLFEGLEEHGLELPRPEQLDEEQSADKVLEIMDALSRQRVFLIGTDHLTARELYSKLFNQTLWEGCYIKRKHPDSMTMMDVSGGFRSKMKRLLGGMLAKAVN